MDPTFYAMLPSGIRIVLTGWIRRRFGYRTFDGDAKGICRAIIDACFDADRGFFCTSVETYRDFWARDFGRVVSSLLALGYEREVASTYRFALERYERHGRFRLVISPRGRLFDFPSYAPDGLAFYVHGLSLLSDGRIVAGHRTFLEKELRRFERKVVDTSTGGVRTDRRFSEAQDYAVRRSSCYTACMCHLLSQSADALGLDNPLSRYDFKQAIHNTYWNGRYFEDDISGKSYVSGDACILPFWTNAALNPSGQFDSVLAALDEAGIMDPLPAKYGGTGESERRMIWMDRINPWQRDAVWTCLGLQFLDVAARLAPERYLKELARYEQYVERVCCFPEVLFPNDLTLFKSPAYRSETAMLWAADLLRMLEVRDRNSACPVLAVV